MHGGIGVTDELDIGFFYKRARVAEMTFGDAAYHRDRFARLQGTDPRQKIPCWRPGGSPSLGAP